MHMRMHVLAHSAPTRDSNTRLLTPQCRRLCWMQQRVLSPRLYILWMHIDSLLLLRLNASPPFRRLELQFQSAIPASDGMDSACWRGRTSDSKESWALYWVFTWFPVLGSSFVSFQQWRGGRRRVEPGALGDAVGLISGVSLDSYFRK